MLIAAVVAYLIGAVLGIAIVLLSAERFSSIKRRVDADIAFMRAMPADVDWGDEQ